jgi:DNA-binding PadR family transcriptional regulator
LRQPKQPAREEPSSNTGKLHSAPKGLLRYYILHKIAEKPIHGYEIIQDIDSRTEGAWRPGAGSLYPILKKLEAQTLIKADKRIGEEEPRRVYRITQKGLDSLAESKSMFSNFHQRWGFLRKLFIELIAAEDVANFFVDNSNRQFQLARELLESKAADISQADIDYMLKEYALGLERQLAWANAMIGETRTKLVAPTTRQKNTRPL